MQRRDQSEHAPLRDVRCFADEELLQMGVLELSPEESRHLSGARRRRPGDRVTVLNGRGQLADAKVVAAGKRVTLVVEGITEEKPPRVRICLAQALLKPKALDLVLQKAVELGVASIVLVQTDHAVAKLGDSRSSGKTERWRQLCIEACKQSANPWLPSIAVFGSVDSAREAFKEGTHQFVAGIQGACSAAELSTRLSFDIEGEIVLWVGPEGDFSEREYEQLAASGVASVRLGARILRAETAALAFTAVVQAGITW